MNATLSRAASYLGALILLTLASLSRMPQDAQGVIWAEDGNVFLTDAMTPGEALTPIHPYAGYLHVIPRLAAEATVRFFPLEDYAIAMTVMACAAVAAVSVITFHCAAAVTDNVWIRAAWAAIPVFVNVGAIETLGNFANFHWYLLWLAPWLLIKPAKDMLEGQALFLIAALTSLTEIISIIFVPLFLYRLTDRRLWPARAGLAVGLACQAYTTLTYPRASGGSYEMDPLSYVYGWFLNTAGPIVYGNSRMIMQQIVNFGAGPMVIASALVIAAVVVVFVFGRRNERWLAALFLTASVLVFMACIGSNPAEYLDYAGYTADDWERYFMFSRYAVVPTMFVLAILPLLASALARFGKTAPVAALSGFGILLASMYYPATTRRDNGPVWADNVIIGTNLCGPARDVDYFEIAVAPDFYKGKVQLPCTVLKDPARQ